MSRGSRREFLKSSVAMVGLTGTAHTQAEQSRPARVRFAAIGLNHGHINGQVDALLRGGGELVSFFAKEPELAAAFGQRHPSARLARDQRDIINDETLQLVVSAAIPNERAALGIEVMRHGKDFMVDTPGATTLAQLAEIRRTQAQT